MGIVYKAEDTKLDRTVAIKVLPSAALASEEDRTRFYREAKAAAQLHHPHIASVFEIDEAVSSDAPHGTEPSPFIAMEFVDGGTLKYEIEKGPMSLKDAVRISAQVAEALKLAHSKDIVHRDIKSHNVMLTKQGEAKVLDFGLAKTAQSTMLTRMGSTLGTVAYMSPEQARGEDVDHRTDIWSLGVLLYEAVAGRLPFAGEYEKAVMYGILNEMPPPLTGIRTGVPMGLEWIVTKLLAKDPGERYQSCAEVIVDLKTVDLSASGMSRTSAVSHASQTVGAVPESTNPRPTFWYRTPAALAAIVLALITGFLVDRLLLGDRDGPTPLKSLRQSFVQIPSGAGLGFPEISPNGDLVTFVGADSVWQFFVFVHDFATGQIHKNETPWFPQYPRFSPDGQWIVYSTQNGLEKLSVPNGAPIPVFQTTERLVGAWESNTSILYTDLAGDVFRVSADGGEPVLVAVPDSLQGHTAFQIPETLPSDGYFLATALTRDDSRDIVIINSRTGEYEILVQDAGYGRFSSTGHLIFIEGGDVEGQVIAQPFDISRRRVYGRRVTTPIGLRSRPDFGIGEDGTIGIINAVRNPEMKFSWISENNINSITDLPIVPGPFWHPSLSPNGTRIVASTFVDENPSGDIFVFNISDGSQQQLTFAGERAFPTWSHDGQYVYYDGEDGDANRLFRRRADGAGAEEIIATPTDYAAEPTPSPDGTRIAYLAEDSETGIANIRAYNLADGTSEEVAAYDTNLHDPVFSPNGRFVAFERNLDDGQILVVREFQGDGYWKISDKELRAWDPKWSPDGQYLYFRNPVALFRVPVRFEPTFSFWGYRRDPRLLRRLQLRPAPGR